MGFKPLRTLSVMAALVVGIVGCTNTPQRDKNILGAKDGFPPNGKSQTVRDPFPRVPADSNAVAKPQNPGLPNFNQDPIGPGKVQPNHHMLNAGPVNQGPNLNLGGVPNQGQQQPNFNPITIPTNNTQTGGLQTFPKMQNQPQLPAAPNNAQPMPVSPNGFNAPVAPTNFGTDPRPGPININP